MAKIVCKILGVLFVVIGLAVFAFGEDADWYHNLLHFVTGIVALYFGFASSRSAAKAFCLASGAAYLAFGLLGFAFGNPAVNYIWDLKLMHLALAEHVFHIVLGTIILAGGLFTKGGGSQKPS
jgi:hypothetical protein